ncbi:hypothetical protein ACO2Q8_06930 [Larkinella sp. VNQ87]|uniref:hypothetical protein n=1 Tax=Larkinella sp. VNQ87 TaxID=3400921 RepID=UPI003BFA8D63
MMDGLWTLPEKVIVRQFYLQNTGLFMVGLMVGFGFLSSNEHIALATYALHDWFFLSGYFALWLLYTVYVLRFSIQVLQTTDLLQLFRLLPTTQRLFLLYLLYLQLLLPVIAYAGFVGWVGSQRGTTTANTVVALVVLLLTVIPLPFAERALHRPNPEPFTSGLGAWIRQRLTTPYVFFYIRYLFREQAATLFLTKTGSCLVTIGLLAIYPTDDYDIRLLSLGALLSGVFHAGLVYELYHFEATQLFLLRNLPVALSKRWVTYIGISGLLLSPEVILLLFRHPNDVSTWEALGVGAFALSLLLLQYTLLLFRHQDRDRFMARLFWPTIVYFFLIMYQLPIWALAFMSCIAATTLFMRYFYRSSW